jgi:hypothetical protein
VLNGIKGADPVIGFADGSAVVVAASSGPGRLVVMSDPSILINRMLEFEGNLQLAINVVRFLVRGGDTPTKRVVLLHGNFVLTGEPQSMLDDGTVKSSITSMVGDVNRWLDEKNDYLLTPDGMQWIAVLAALLVGLIGILALHVRRGPELDGAWTRGPSGTSVGAGSTDIDQLVARYDRGDAGANLILPAAILRDGIQAALGALVERPDPLYSMPEAELVAAVEARRGRAAGSALRALYRRLKLLPGRAQAASPWSSGQLGRREFERLHDDVRELYRTLAEAPHAPYEREPDGR